MPKDGTPAWMEFLLYTRPFCQNIATDLGVLSNFPWRNQVMRSGPLTKKFSAVSVCLEQCKAQTRMAVCERQSDYCPGLLDCMIQLCTAACVKALWHALREVVMVPDIAP